MAVLCLADELSGKTTNSSQISCIREEEHHLLNASCFISCYTLTDGLRATNECIREVISRRKNLSLLQKQRLGLLIGIPNHTWDHRCPLNIFVVAPNALAM